MLGRTTSKLHPFKLLVFLIWGDFKGRTWLRPGRLKVRTYPLASKLKVDNKKVKEYLKELEKLLLVTDLFIGHGYFLVTICEPSLWKGIREQPPRSQIPE